MAKRPDFKVDVSKIKEPLDTTNLNLRYKLSDPELILREKCTSKTCVNSDDRSNSVASILKEAFSGLNASQKSDGFRGPAHTFVPIGAMISPDVKRMEFTSYLKQSGFITSIAKLLLTLYDMDKLPADEEAIEFMTRKLGYGLTSKRDYPAAKAYKHLLEKQVKKYKEEVDMLKRILDNFQTTETPIEVVDPKKLPSIQYTNNTEQSEQMEAKVLMESSKDLPKSPELVEIKSPPLVFNDKSQVTIN